MSFIEKNLSANEKIIYSAELHWYIYVRGILFLAVAIIVAVFASGKNYSTAGYIFAGIIGVLAITYLVNAFSIVKSTEFVVTNKRVMVKTGIVNRKLIELQLNRSEGMTIEQGILGRIFNFGTIRITSGGVVETFFGVADPYEFKKHVNNAIEGSFNYNPNSPLN